MDYFFLFIGIVILILALLMFFKFRKNQQIPQKTENLRTQKDENGKIDFVRCPLCQTPLAKNEDMFSRIYRPMNSLSLESGAHAPSVEKKFRSMES